MLAPVDSTTLLYILGRLLAPGTDWKRIVAEEGLKAAKAKLNPMWKAKLAKHTNRDAQAMTADGWNWTSAADPAFLKGEKVPDSEAAKGPGFCFTRDAVFVLLRTTGVPGGVVRDGWRDAVDDALWEDLQASGAVVEGETPTRELVSAVAVGLVDKVL
jgi:hypothetical protein